MRFSHFFVDRPIFASVVSIILTVVAIVASFGWGALVACLPALILWLALILTREAEPALAR